MAYGRNKVNVFHEAELAFTRPIYRGAMPRCPDSNVLDIARQITSATAAGQLDSRRSRIADGHYIQIAVAINLYAGEEHAPHVAACSNVK